MPLVRKIETELWEVRSDISFGNARIIFTIQEDLMVLLHGFVKKTQKIPKKELDVSRVGSGFSPLPHYTTPQPACPVCSAQGWAPPKFCCFVGVIRNPKIR